MPTPQTVDVYANGELVIEGRELPRKGPTERVNPTIVLKIDRPEGVRTGDLVELRVVTRPATSESLAGGHGQAALGPRVFEPAFGEPR